MLSTEKFKKNELTKELYSIYSDFTPRVKEYHGEWGSLIITKNHYEGFDPYETEEYLVLVIGGPVLMFRDNNFLKSKNSSEGTKSIFYRWLERKIRWDEDLSGPFVVIIINKITSEIICFTDLMSFIPVYTYCNGKSVYLSTHVDVLANISKQAVNIDDVSVIDFILHGTVTYPHTIYKSIFQISPSSEHRVVNKSLESKFYWLPNEENMYESINIASVDLIAGLNNYLDRIITNIDNIAQFISGGEDSRLIAALLQKKSRDAYIILDSFNREGKIANKAAKAYGAKFNLLIRDKNHYINILPSSSDLIGSGSEYKHAHTYGYQEIFGKYQAVFGGLLADAFLKGSHIKNKEFPKCLSFIPQIKDINHDVTLVNSSDVFSPIVLKEIENRRKKHFNYIKQFRQYSCDEWFTLWPASMNPNISNLHINRRLFCSYEPFMSKDVIKVSATVPQKWKLNKRFFQKSTKLYFHKTKWLTHTDGRLPYFPWYVNIFSQSLVRISRRIGRFITRENVNQGPWSNWDYILSSSEWNKIFSEYSRGMELFEKYFAQSDFEKVYMRLNKEQKINLVQTLYKINYLYE